MCPKAFFVLILIEVSLYFAVNLSKAECGDFERKNVEETTYGAYDGPSCLWRSVGGSVEKLLKEDGEFWPSVGLRSLWRSVVAMMFRPAGSSWSSEKWSQHPNSKSWSVLKLRPSTDHCTYDGPSYLPSRVVKRAVEEIAQVWDDGVHDGPSWQRWSVVRSVNPAVFWQISSKQSPCLTRFFIFYK